MNFVVSGYVNPGAGMSVITHTVKEEVGKLKSDDVVVVWGVPNDIGKNNSQQTLRHLRNFVEKRQRVNIVVMTAPPRYDLIPSSCVNNEVVRFNRQLKKRTKMFNNVTIFETDLKRGYFTKHGLHLNAYGKEQIALKLAVVVKRSLNKNRTSRICLQWKENPTSPMKITVLKPAPQQQWEGDIMIMDQARNNDSSVSSNVEASTDELVQDKPIHMGPTKGYLKGKRDPQ
jgi:hypothetical protein